jgi:hypothetical protein
MKCADYSTCSQLLTDPFKFDKNKEKREINELVTMYEQNLKTNMISLQKFLDTLI